MNPFTTDGAISWQELMTADPEQAKNFYNKTIGWTSRSMPMEDGQVYNVIHAADFDRGGIMALPAEGIPPYWGIYITSFDVHKVAAQAEELGATILMPVTTAGGVGSFCTIQGPTGAVFSVIEYDPREADPEDPQPEFEFESSFSTHGAFSWFELRTSDAEKAAAFYSTLFGWETKTEQMPMGPYTVLSISGVGFGGISGLPDPNIPPHWGSYVTVDDVDATAAAVNLEGGTIVMPPTDIEGVGRLTIFLDPGGAALSAITYATAPAE